MVTHLGASTVITDINYPRIRPKDDPDIVGTTFEEFDGSFCMVVAGLLDLSSTKANTSTFVEIYFKKISSQNNYLGKSNKFTID